MGAIFGVLGNASDAELGAMADAVAHRGKKVHVRRYAADLAVGALGADPAESVLPVGDGILVCDAAIYNAADVLLHLDQNGVAMPVRTPAAILGALLDHGGPGALERVNGDYAFALIDRHRGEVLFGRDYVGSRPLYYTVLPSGGLAFASEYKALLRLSEVRPKLDRDMVQYLQCAKTLPAGRTLLANVKEVLPTGTTRLSRTGAVLARTEFAPIVVDGRITDEAEAADAVLHRLSEAVRRQAQDVARIGVALSGGIDSIGIAFLLRALYPDREIHSFTAGYGPQDPEMIRAAQVAKCIGSIHHEVLTGPALVRDRLYDLVWHLEDPCARSEALQLYWLGAAAQDKVDALFVGDGGDTLFGGMPRHRLLWLMERLPPLRQSLQELYDLTQLGRPPVHPFARMAAYACYRGRVPAVPRVVGARMPGPSPLPPVTAEYVNINCAGVFSRLGERRGYKHDRAYGAWGLVARSPFNDVELARTAFAITDRLKIRWDVNKYVLRKALAPIVPEQFRRAAKIPQRMRYDLQFAEALDSVAATALSDAAVRRRGLFEPDDIRRLFRLRKSQRYGAEGAMRLWTAVLTEFWAQQFLDQPGRSAYRPDVVRPVPAAEPAGAVGDSSAEALIPTPQSAG